jgi:hypothetical protein
LLDSALVTEWAHEAGTVRPLSPSTHTALSESLVAVGSSDTTTIHLYDLAGTHHASLSLELTARSATEAHARRAAEALAVWIGDAAVRSRLMERFAAIPPPERLPHYAGLYFDSAETLWLVLSFPGDSTTSLRGYGTDGSTLRHVEVPVGLAVFEIGVDYVLGAYVDETSGEPHVAVYTF